MGNTLRPLFEAALAASAKAAAGYSGFPVGIAIETAFGPIHTGTNLEAVTRRGLEATHVAIGRMATNSGRIFGGRASAIQRIAYSVPVIDETWRYLPSPDARGLLAAFAKADTPLYFKDRAGTIRRHALEDLIRKVPFDTHSAVPFAERKARLTASRKALNDAQLPEDVMDRLLRARAAAINPESRYSVGVVIRDGQGALFSGCNIEYASHVALHAEQMACGDMVTTVGPKAEIADLYVMVDDPEPWFPCPVCINTIAEFRQTDTLIHAVGSTGAVVTKRYDALYTDGFDGYRVRHRGGLPVPPAP